MNYSDDFREMIRKYNEELKQMQRKSKDLQEQTIFVQSENVQEQPIGQEQTPTNEFQFQNEYSIPNISADQVIPGQTTALEGEGYLKVRVSTANSAAPVIGANVVISFDKGDEEQLVKSVFTDSNGETPQFSLPTVAVGESLSPGVKNPYAAYSVRVSSDGYFTIDLVNTPIFDKQLAILPVEMIPLPQDFGGSTVLKSNDTGSISLN